MCRDAAVLGVAQLVLQSLGIGPECGFGHVVGQIARRVGDSLLRAGLDADSWALLPEHARNERAHAMNHAPEVHVHGVLPVLEAPHGTAAPPRVAALFMSRPTSPNVA